MPVPWDQDMATKAAAIAQATALGGVVIAPPKPKPGTGFIAPPEKPDGKP